MMMVMLTMMMMMLMMVMMNIMKMLMTRIKSNFHHQDSLFSQSGFQDVGFHHQDFQNVHHQDCRILIIRILKSTS